MKGFPRLLVRLAMVAVLVPLGAALSAAPAHAVGPRISSFYPATIADNNAWASRKYAPPPKTMVFPSGTEDIAFYFAYSGASSTVFVGIVEDSQGKVLYTNEATLSNGSSSEMFWVGQAHHTFADGTYTATITLGGLPAATTTFTVSGTAPAPNGNGSSPSGGTVKISRFYPVSQNDFNNWVKLNYPVPARASNFAAGKTWWFPFYFSYSGAIAKTTQFSGDVRTAAGALAASAGPYTLTYKSGQQEFYIPLPHKADYANGTYTAELLINNSVVATTSLNVGVNGAKM